jgi:hypothetical protein
MPKETSPAKPIFEDEAFRDKMRDEYDSGLDRVPTARQEREQEEKTGGPMEDVLRFAAGFGGGLGLEA